MTISIGPRAKVGDLEVTGSLRTATHRVSSGDDEHQLSANGSLVYFKYSQKLTIASATTTTGSPNVTITTVEDHGLNHAGSDGATVTLSNFATADDLDGLALSDFDGDKVINNWTNALSTKQFQIVAASANASTGATLTATSGAVTIRVYKYLELSGASAQWQVAYHTAPTGAHAN
jgi:hypothetical protein